LESAIDTQEPRVSRLETNVVGLEILLKSMPALSPKHQILFCFCAHT
jgi:hypothetical protein